jgi:hypothetical protein
MFDTCSYHFSPLPFFDLPRRSKLTPLRMLSLIVNNGTISVEEFEAVMASLGQHPTKEQLTDMVARVSFLAFSSPSPSSFSDPLLPSRSFSS